MVGLGSKENETTDSKKVSEHGSHVGTFLCKLRRLSAMFWI